MHFDSIAIAITEIQYWGNLLIVVLEHENTDLTRAPKSIGRCRCIYLFKTEMGRPHTDDLSARRASKPMEGDIDNTEYTTLRPGVMLGSGSTPLDIPKYLTSSGAVVEDNIGNNRYMKIASHSFLYREAVLRPSAAIGRRIRKVIREISHTDVALAELQGECPFENKTFESTPNESSLTKFVPADALMIFHHVCTNTPCSGYIQMYFAFKLYISNKMHIIQ